MQACNPSIFAHMDVTITIDKDVVMSDVYKITGYTGAKSGDMDKISSSEDELSLLAGYYDDALSFISDIVSGVGYLSGEGSLCLNLPANWNSKVKTALEKSMKKYTVSYICMQWFNLTKKDDVKYYEDLCSDCSLSIRRYLAERIKPTRK